MQGRRPVAWEPGSRNATALPCPPVFRPSARVRWSNCRSWWAPPPGPWLLARRLGEARRPVAALAWCWIWGRTARRRSGKVRFSAASSVRLGAGSAVCSARCDREQGFLGARRVRLGAGKRRPFHSRNRILESFRSVAVARAELLGARGVRLGAGARVASLGGGPGGRSARRRSSSRLASAVLLPGSNCRSQTNCVTRASTVSLMRCFSARWSPGGTRFGGCGASIWRSASTGASVQRLGGARPQL